MDRNESKKARGVPSERFVLLPDIYPQQVPNGTKNDQQLHFKNKKVCNAPHWYAVQVRFFFSFTKRKEEQNKFTTMITREI